MDAMFGLYELNAEGYAVLTAEALQWYREGKLKSINKPILDPYGSGMIVDYMFMGFEPCDPEVARILEERTRQIILRTPALASMKLDETMLNSVCIPDPPPLPPSVPVDDDDGDDDTPFIVEVK